MPAGALTGVRGWMTRSLGQWDWEVGRAGPGSPREVSTGKCSRPGDEIGGQGAAQVRGAVSA